MPTNYPTGDTFNYGRVDSDVPFPDVTPRDPLGHGATPDVSFGTGPIRVEANGNVTTNSRGQGSLGGNDLDGGVV